MKTLIPTLTAIAFLTVSGTAFAQSMQVSENGSREGFLGSSDYLSEPRSVLSPS